LRGRAEAIPLKSDTFDTVISTFPSNYIFNEASLREIKRVLNREGRCLVLGLGVRFESGLKRWLTSLWMSKHLENLIQVFMQRTEKMGLRAVCIQHQADGYSLPVVILERSHAN
jgi:ubiquinone/menaquinone biosynthesis C-methylase UbiE